jgi:hypothetical protein
VELVVGRVYRDEWAARRVEEIAGVTDVAA